MGKNKVPKVDELMDPSVQALKSLGGSASIEELVPEIVRLLGLSQEVADVPHGTTSRTELEYRAAWARTYLRKAGLIENSERGIWALTPEGAKAATVNGRQIARDIAKRFRSERATDNESGDPVAEEPDTTLSWQDKLIAVLQTMDPVAFERLCQRILRESGFIEVEVTKRGGDGGIRWLRNHPYRRIDQFQRPVSEQTVQGKYRAGGSPRLSRCHGWAC